MGKNKKRKRKVVCSATSDCAKLTATPVCDTATKVCVAATDKCTSNTECASEATNKVCDIAVSPKVCVQCLTTSDCASLTATPICDTANKTCIAAPGKCFDSYKKSTFFRTINVHFHRKMCNRKILKNI